MTNHWIDIKNSDVILIMGSNAAENHPISFRWVTEARVAGAKLISVDPRFTRTSSKADVYAPLRSGTDIAFLGGMLNYILQNDLIHNEYVVEYTNAAYLVDENFEFDPATGLFSGHDGSTYADKSSWVFQTDADGVILRDKTLEDPRCVYQIIKEHYSRYDLDTVSGITGTPGAKLQEVYETYALNSYEPGKAGTIMYAMGWTQHTVGAQNIRAMSMIQLLLGNIGVAGGGVNALRGESNVQGSTDHCLLFHIWPGYLKCAEEQYPTLAEYNAKWTPTATPTAEGEPQSANWWGNYPKYSVSFLKSMFGAAATADNDFAYSWMPKRDQGANYAWQCMFDAMYRGEIKGFFAWGQNPANSSANANKIRAALAKLDWLVCVNIYGTETSEFWRGPGMNSADIDTEVFELPCAASVEKEGSITNSGRWAQWRYKAVDPPGDAMPDSEIMNELFLELQALYGAGGVFPDPILNCKWDYFDGSEAVARLIAKEINGYFLEDYEEADGTARSAGDLVPSFSKLRDDGKTSSGNWLYCNSYVDHDFDTGNKMARRTRSDPVTDIIGLNAEWSWCWPVNRRIVYNRASVDLTGQPYDVDHPVIAWTGDGWAGDVPDGGWPPMDQGEASRLPFIMQPDGVGKVFANVVGASTVDGPIPEHYEPVESPLASHPFGAGHARFNPVAIFCESDLDLLAAPGSSEYPIVCSSYRMVEHWQTGVMTRWVPWLNELQPEMWVEMSEELAAEKGIANGERVTVRSIRGEVQAVAIVTKRFKPFTIMGNTVHQVGVPWCFGWVAPNLDPTRVTNGNLLTPNVGDPNTRIPESKAFMVDVVKEA
jgi:formate dehydrogenase major subunit